MVFQASELVDEMGEGSSGVLVHDSSTGSLPTAFLARAITVSEVSPGAMR